VTINIRILFSLPQCRNMRTGFAIAQEAPGVVVSAAGIARGCKNTESRATPWSFSSSAEEDIQSGINEEIYAATDLWYNDLFDAVGFLLRTSKVLEPQGFVQLDMAAVAKKPARANPMGAGMPLGTYSLLGCDAAHNYIQLSSL
jgi:hypothetical protein